MGKRARKPITIMAPRFDIMVGKTEVICSRLKARNAWNLARRFCKVSTDGKNIMVAMVKQDAAQLVTGILIGTGDCADAGGEVPYFPVNNFQWYLGS